MYRRWFLLVWVSLALTFGVSANEPMRGAGLAGSCRVREGAGRECIAYALGVRDGQLLLNPTVYCIPDSVSARELADLLSEYITVHVERYMDNGAQIFQDAVSEKYPCK